MNSVSRGVARRRCAVVFNPTKVSDQFHDLVEKCLHRDGWVDTVWLETSADDSGRAMTKTAVAERVDLVIAAGGDGTVRLVADGLAGTGIAMGLVPAGTGNLLARNLGLPLDEVSAVEVAFAGHTRRIDLIELTVDDGAAEHCAVLAGIGVDAMIMDETDPRLKEAIGWGAYVVAAGKALGRAPVQITVRLDGHRPVRRRAMVCLVGNVGTLQGNITLIPGATPFDGLLDLYIASPHRLVHWLKLGLRLATGRPKKDDQVDQHTAKTVTITIHGGAESYQLDGDVIGEANHLSARIKPDALTICVLGDDPPRPTQPSAQLNLRLLAQPWTATNTGGDHVVGGNYPRGGGAPGDGHRAPPAVRTPRAPCSARRLATPRAAGCGQDRRPGRVCPRLLPALHLLGHQPTSPHEEESGKATMEDSKDVDIPRF